MSIAALIDEALEELRQTDSPRVLLAEDDPDFAALLEDSLTQQGFEVVLACDGEALVEHISVAGRTGAPPFDLIVTDVRMPGKTGIEALEALRERDWSTPVLVMSAYLGLVEADEALRLGAAAVLSKPFAVTRFEHEVERIISAGP